MAIQHGFNLCRHLDKVLALCVELRVYLDPFFRICAFCLSSSYSIFMWRLLYVCRYLTFLLGTECATIVGSNPLFSSGYTIHSSETVPKAIRKGLWSTKGFLRKAHLKFLEWEVYADLMCKSCWKSLLCPLGRLYLCSVIRPHLLVTQITSDSVWGGIVMSSATRNEACLSYSPICTPYDNVRVTFSSVPSSNIPTGSECSGTVLSSIGKTPQIYISIYFFSSKTLAARV